MMNTMGSGMSAHEWHGPQTIPHNEGVECEKQHPLVEARREIELLTKQRDELLAALERIYGLPEKYPQDPIACLNKTYLIAELAIASVKESK